MATKEPLPAAPSSPSQPPSTTASSVTATSATHATMHATNSAAANGADGSPDPEAGGVPPASASHVSHWRHLVDHAGITPAVLAAYYPGDGTEASPYVVSFLPDDPYDAQLYPKWKKWTLTLVMAFATLGVSFVSTAYTGGVEQIMVAFDVSTEVAILGVSLFVLGFAIGPLLWAPSSEFFGRQVLFAITYAILTLFNMGAALSKNIQTLIIMRFFAGSFGSSPLTNAGGVIADLFSAKDRGLATAVFAAAPFLGPSLGPIVAGFLGETSGWRWVEWLMTIFTGVMCVTGALVVPETYAPVLLRRRAAALSERTGKVYVSRFDMHHRHANGQGPTMAAQYRTALSRPWILLFREPIVFITSLYMAIIYGTMYMMFAAFPIIFQQTRGWSPGIGGLAFLGIAVGMMVAVLYAVFDNRNYMRHVAASPTGAAPPEARLPAGIIGSVLLPIGLFWFAWTNKAPVPWIVPIIGSGFFATGLVLVFLSLMNYLIDSYVIFAASVLAASAVIRSLFGAAFPLFTTYMYHDLGLHWASSVPAFLALACVPFPFLFKRYGESIRMRCKFASEAAEVLKRMRQMQQQPPPPASAAPADNEIDEDDAFEEAEEREVERKLTRELTRKSTHKGHHGLNLGLSLSHGTHDTHGDAAHKLVDDAGASGSGTVDNEKAAAADKPKTDA